MNQMSTPNRSTEHVPEDLIIDFDAPNDPQLKSNLFQRQNEIRNTAPPLPIPAITVATGWSLTRTPYGKC